MTVRTTLRLRFTLVIMAVIVGVAATLGAYFFHQLSRSTDEALRARAVSLASGLAYNSEYGTFVANRVLLRRSAEAVMREPDVEYVLIEDRHGRILTGLGRFETESAPASLQPAAASGIDPPRLIEYVNRGGVHLLEAAAPILLRPDEALERELNLSDDRRSWDPEWIGGVRVGLSREPSRLQQAGLRRAAILIALCTSLLGMAVAVVFVRRIVGPLKSLLLGTQRIAQGDLNHRVEVVAQDEIGELAESFNRMTNDLLRARTQLEAYSTALESKVRERTRSLEDTQSRLLQSEKLSAIGKLVAGVAHELNNPLTGILGYAQLLQRHAVGGESAKALDRICNEAMRCKKIVQNLLTFARRKKTAKSPTNVNRVLERTLDLRTYELRLDNVEIVMDLQPDLPPIRADFHQLQQVILNILMNAHQAMIGMSSDRRLTVRTRKRGESLFIEIEDNGPGIPAPLRERIFDPFFTTKEVGGGTGLGLSICYGIVEEHGGRIVVESEAGKGARFIIELPYVIEGQNLKAESGLEEARTAPVSAASSGALAVRETLRVLIVDDEPSVLDILHQALNQDGFEAENARNGSEALKRIVKEKPDLIITDMRMPGMGGAELYSRVKALDPALAERMVFITGDTINQETRTFLERCGNRFLEKPFDLNEVSALLRECEAELRQRRVLVH